MRKLLVMFFVSGLFAGHLLAQDSIPDLGNSEKSGQTKAGHGQRFVDEDGDGYNDNAPDHDGDGIPNGLDPDWNKHKNQEFIDVVLHTGMIILNYSNYSDFTDYYENYSRPRPRLPALSLNRGRGACSLYLPT